MTEQLAAAPTTICSSLPGMKKTVTFPPFNELTKLIYGEPKVGKTSFVDSVTNHYFIATESGHDFVKSPVVRIDRWGWEVDKQGKPILAPGEVYVPTRQLPDGTVVTNFKDHVRQVTMARRAGGWNMKVTSIDIIDNLYQMCLDATCKRKGIEYPPETDFGKTWKEVTSDWRTWLQRLLDVISINFLTHTTTDKIEVKQGNGINKEIERRVPTFKGNKAAQYLDGVINCMGFAFFDGNGNRCITFAGDVRLASGDRSGLLEKVGPQLLNWTVMEKAYNDKAKELGIELKSKWS